MAILIIMLVEIIKDKYDLYKFRKELKTKYPKLRSRI
jgi:predicted amino acid-binding ACT domain protein